MNLVYLLGGMLLALAAALLAPAVLAAVEGEGILSAFLTPALAAAASGLVAMLVFRGGGRRPLRRREIFLFVPVAWGTASLIGALPYMLAGASASWVDALFESASGFTTTGASVLLGRVFDSPSLLLWRSMTQWLGGMGILAFGIVVLPRLVIGGMESAAAEGPGPVQEKVTPRSAKAALYLWVIYAALTAVMAFLLTSLGLGPLVAIQHAMTTMALGGFSTEASSIAGHGSVWVELVFIVFMIVAGANFALHYRTLRGQPWALPRDPEFRFFLGLWAIASMLIVSDLWLNDQHESLGAALRHGVFQTTSMLTTGGFSSTDYDLWPAFSRAMLLLLMFVGACTGSTGGSVKAVRVLILIKKSIVDLKKLIQPSAVLPVRVGRQALSDELVSSVTTFVLLYLVISAAGGLLLSLAGVEMFSAFGAAAACLGNVGPAFGELGPYQGYAVLPAPAKLLLTVLMLAGRLELYPILILPLLRR